MEYIYAHDQQYTKIENEVIIKDPLPFGPTTLTPGMTIRSFGDGRAWRSFSMDKDFLLEYVGYVQLENLKLLLFSVYNFEPFKRHGFLYSFYYVSKDLLFIVRAVGGGCRDIIPKNVEVVHDPEAIKYLPSRKQKRKSEYEQLCFVECL